MRRSLVNYVTVCMYSIYVSYKVRRNVCQDMLHDEIVRFEMLKIQTLSPISCLEYLISHGARLLRLSTLPIHQIHGLLVTIAASIGPQVLLVEFEHISRNALLYHPIFMRNIITGNIASPSVVLCIQKDNTMKLRDSRVVIVSAVY